MGNRMIKESIRTSKTVNAMTDFQFRVWIYLITYVDDYGRGSADPELIKGFVFPRRRRVSEADIERTLAELAGMGCISLYDVDGESYFCFPTWSAHQRIQRKYSQFPAPEDGCPRGSARADGGPRQSTVTHGESPIEPEAEPGNKNLEPETEADASCAEPDAASAPLAIALPLNDGTEYPVSMEQCREWAELYPAVDVLQQLRGMRGWLDANPQKRKTRRGVRAFINSWLSREQDRGGGAGKEKPWAYDPGEAGERSL